MSKKYLISFASPDLSRSAKRFYTQARLLNYFDKVIVFSTSDLNNVKKKKLLDLIKLKKKKRGYGYWYWKPLIIKQFLKKINFNDSVAYADVGCHINLNGIKKLKNYYKKLDTSRNGIITFQYNPLKKYNAPIYEYPDRKDSLYSKGDLLNYFKALNKNKIINTQQYWAGFFILKKNNFNINLVNKWVAVFEKRFDLVDDTPSKIKNLPNFIHNQADQSIFSILCKIYNIPSYSAYECDWFYFKGKRYWSHTNKNPIVAKRDLKYNPFKRFTNRQIRTYRRYKEKILNYLSK